MSQNDNDVSDAVSLQPPHSPGCATISVSMEAVRRSTESGSLVTGMLAPSSSTYQNKADEGKYCKNVSYFNRETGTPVIKITSSMFKMKVDGANDRSTGDQELCPKLTSNDPMGKLTQESENTRETDLMVKRDGKSEVWHNERDDAVGEGLDKDEMEVEEKLLYIDDDDKCDLELLSDNVHELSGDVRASSDNIQEPLGDVRASSENVWMCSVVEQRHVKTTFRPFQNTLQLDFDTKQKVDDVDCGYSKHYSCYQTRTDCNSKSVNGYLHKSDHNSNWVVPYYESSRSSSASVGSESSLTSSTGPLQLKRQTASSLAMRSSTFAIASPSSEVIANATSTYTSNINTFIGIPLVDGHSFSEEGKEDQSQMIDANADWPADSSSSSSSSSLSASFAESTENTKQQGQPKSVDMKTNESMLPAVARLHEQVVNSSTLLPGGSTNASNVSITLDHFDANRPVESEKLRKMRLKRQQQQKPASGFIRASQIKGNKGTESIEELLSFINGDGTKYMKNGTPPQKTKKSVHDENQSKKKKVPTATLR